MPQLPSDVVYAILSHAETLPLYVLCRICKWANTHGKSRPTHVDMRQHCIQRQCRKIPREHINVQSLTLGKRWVDPAIYTSLTSLDICNELDDFTLASLCTLPCLRRLVFDKNQRITNEGISKLTQLRHIYCNNTVTDRGIAGMDLYTISVGASITSVMGFSELCTLHLGSNMLPIPQTIERLYIAGSNITEHDLAPLTRLHTLSITGRTRISSLGTFTNLRTLELLTAEVSGIPPTVTRLRLMPGTMRNVTDNKLLVMPADHMIKVINGKKYALAVVDGSSRTNQRSHNHHRQRKPLVRNH